MSLKQIESYLKPLIEFIEINGFSEINVIKPNCILARYRNEDWAEYGEVIQ